MSRPHERGGGMVLRATERRLLDRARAGQAFEGREVADLIERLGRTRGSGEGVMWRAEYEELCDAFGLLLALAERAKHEHRRATGRLGRDLDLIERELERVKEERDALREEAKHAFATGRRSAGTLSA